MVSFDLQSLQEPIFLQGVSIEKRAALIGAASFLALEIAAGRLALLLCSDWLFTIYGLNTIIISMKSSTKSVKKVEK